MAVNPRAVLLGIATCLAALVGQVAAAPPETSGAKPSANETGFELLFNGREFQGWEQAGGWKVAEGAFYHQEAFEDGAKKPTARRELRKGEFELLGTGRGDPDLHYVGGRIPGDCELVFEWREGGAQRRAGRFNPGLEISYSRGVHGAAGLSYRGAAIDYSMSGISVRLHTRGMADRSPVEVEHMSGIASRGQVRDFSAPVAQWNRGRILCKGSRVQFWLNGNMAFDLDFEKELLKRKQANGEPNIETLAAADWIKHAPQGIYLSVAASMAGDESPLPVVQIRAVQVRKLLATEQLTAQSASPPR